MHTRRVIATFVGNGNGDLISNHGRGFSDFIYH